MTRRRLAALAGLALVFTPACAVDLALAGGATVPQSEPSATRALWTGELRTTLQAAGAAEIGNVVVDHLTLGLELQGRAAHGQGAFYTGGGSLGLAFSDGSYQAFAQFEGGVPLGFSGQLRGYYVGLNTGLLWALVPRPAISGPNTVFHLLEQRTFLGPMLRYRREDVAPSTPSVPHHDVAFGLQMRVMIGTDLL
jgi:hypothetical protein